MRFHDYGPLLAQQGIVVTPAPFFDDAYLERLYAGRSQPVTRIVSYYWQRLAALLSKNRYDLVWLEKEALPWLPAWLELPLLRGIPFAIDFDDAWFHRYDQHRNPVVRRLLQAKFPALVQQAAVVIAGSPYLAEWAEAHGARKVVRLPTTVDLPRYQMKQPNQSKDFVIGWMGSPSTTPYLRPIADALTNVQGATLKLVGAEMPLPHGRGRETYGEAVSRTGEGVTQRDNSPQPTPLPDVLSHSAKDIPSPMRERVIMVPWHEDTETTELTSFDVGIMPLPADAWSEGKCAYKLIQYMATGLPVVASPVGMNREVVQHGINGFLADTNDEWITALTALRNNPVLRHSMGTAGRKLVEEKYSLAGNADLLAATLRNAVSAGSQGR